MITEALVTNRIHRRSLRNLTMFDTCNDNNLPLPHATEEKKIRGVRRFGPVTIVDVDREHSLKLYSFCKRSFQHLSKGVLSKCFNNASIFVNSERIRPGHEDESRRLVEGDIVEVQIDLDIANALIVEKTDLQVLHIQNGYAILFKPSGLSSAFDKEMDKALKSKLWDGGRKNTCQLLYNLEKGFSGLCIVAEDSYNLLKLRGLLCANPNVKDDTTSFTGDNCDIHTDSDRYDILLNDSSIACCMNDSDINSSRIDENGPNYKSDSNVDSDGNTIRNKSSTDCNSTISPSHDYNNNSVTPPEHSRPPFSPFIELIHRCIISGKVGEVGDTVFIETGHKDYPVCESYMNMYFIMCLNINVHVYMYVLI